MGSVFCSHCREVLHECQCTIPDALVQRAIYKGNPPAREFSSLVGETITEVLIPDDQEYVAFVLASGAIVGLTHFQGCCEAVWLEEVIGEWSWLIGRPLVRAEETDSQHVERDGSQTWTFYTLATSEGTVTMRWCGESNGYYSESVDVFDVVVPGGPADAP